VYAAWVSTAGANQPVVTTDPPPAEQPVVPPAVGPAGQTGDLNVNIPEKVANPGQPLDVDEFRLIPYGYVQALSHIEKPFPKGSPREVSGLNVLGDTPLKDGPGYLPAGYALSEAKGIEIGEEVVGVGLIYEGPSFPIQVVKRLVARDPIDVYQHPSTSHVTISVGEVGGETAIFQQAKPGDKYQVPISVRFVRENIEFILEWRVSGPTEAGAQFQELLKVAESLTR
jgi:hypothetical protein